MMFHTTRLSKVSLFLMCDIAMLRSMRIQHPDNRVSDPTDLAINPDVNRFITMIVIVLKCWRAVIWRNCAPRSQNSQMFSSSNDHRSAHRNLHRTRSGTCGLVHKPSFDSTFQLSLRNSAHLCRLRCAVHVPTSFPGFAHRKPCAVARRAFRNTSSFIKN